MPAALFYPREFPRKEGQSNAERKVYNALQALDSKWTVYHSVAWHNHSPDYKPDGEADFVLMHKQLGMIVVEVKGGGIEYDPYTHAYYSLSGPNRYLIDNPWTQAKASKNFFINLIKPQIPNPENHWISNAHIVIFPDCQRRQLETGSEADPAVTFFYEDLAELPEKLLRLLQDAQRYNSDPGIAAIFVNKFHQIFGQPWEVHPSFPVRLSDESQEMLVLTQDQYGLLNNLQYLHRAIIQGGAGTGKTFLAAEKALRHARAGQRVLLTCFNNALAARLRNSGDIPDNLMIRNFHDLCVVAARQAGLPVSDEQVAADQQQYYFNTELPGMLERAIALDPGFRFDTIIVDEGQDFRAEWWVLLTDLLKAPDRDKDGTFWIFQDQNQSLQNHQSVPFDWLVVPLIENLRNTRCIANHAHRFFQGTIRISDRAPAGSDLRLIQCASDYSDLNSLVIRELRQLIQDQRVRPQDIAVLSGGAKDKIGIMIPESLAGCSDGSQSRPGNVIVDTIRRFKGIESPVVILIRLTSSDKDGSVRLPTDQLLYVGMTRAISHLIVIDTAAVLDHIKTAQHGAAESGPGKNLLTKALSDPGL